jgi:hypothetical protein
MSLALEYPPVGQWLRTALSTGPDTVGASAACLKLKTETDQLSEKFHSFLFLFKHSTERAMVEDDSRWSLKGEARVETHSSLWVACGGRRYVNSTGFSLVYIIPTMLHGHLSAIGAI